MCAHCLASHLCHLIGTRAIVDDAICTLIYSYSRSNLTILPKVYLAIKIMVTEKGVQYYLRPADHLVTTQFICRT